MDRGAAAVRKLTVTIRKRVHLAESLVCDLSEVVTRHRIAQRLPHGQSRAVTLSAHLGALA